MSVLLLNMNEFWFISRNQKNVHSAQPQYIKFWDDIVRNWGNSTWFAISSAGASGRHSQGEPEKKHRLQIVVQFFVVVRLIYFMWITLTVKASDLPNKTFLLGIARINPPHQQTHPPTPFGQLVRPPGWQKLCGGTGGLRQKVWTRTKILSPNIRHFVAN